jgi:hypothetical protein
MFISSSTFQRVEENTEKIYKFQRYRLIFEYEKMLILPPPLIIIPHLIELIKVCHNKRISNNKKNENLKITDVQKYETENGRFYSFFFKFKNYYFF